MPPAFAGMGSEWSAQGCLNATFPIPQNTTAEVIRAWLGETWRRDGLAYKGSAVSGKIDNWERPGSKGTYAAIVPFNPKDFALMYCP